VITGGKERLRIPKKRIAVVGNPRVYGGNMVKMGWHHFSNASHHHRHQKISYAEKL
jgi:hypothetical protein